MRLTVRGFKKTSLKKFKNVKASPLCAISPKNQEELKISKGETEINGLPAQIIDGSSDQFIGMTKTLRENLGVEIGQTVEVSFEKSALKIS